MQNKVPMPRFYASLLAIIKSIPLLYDIEIWYEDRDLQFLARTSGGTVLDNLLVKLLNGNESTPGDMIWYREIVPWLTLAVQTTDEVGSSLGSKLVAADSTAFEALRRAHVNEIPDAIRGRGMNNLLADRLKVDTNVGRLAVRLGWSLSNHYWCRYPECKLYGKTSRESHMVSDLVEVSGKELL
ncbi:DNA glycosylase [Tanacetum coccineum]